MIEVAGLQRGRDVGRHQPKILCLAHDFDRHVAVLDRCDGDAVQSAVGGLAVVRDPRVVEPGEARGELGILERRRAEPEAGIEHHRVDLVAIGVAEHALGRPAVDPLRRGDAVLGRTARSRPAGLGIVSALDDQTRRVAPRLDVFRPALHRLDRQGCPLGDVSVSVNDPHLCKDTTSAPLPIACSLVIVLLPPSETKRAGGDGPPLRLDALSFPALRPVRAALVDELVALAADPARLQACARTLAHPRTTRSIATPRSDDRADPACDQPVHRRPVRRPRHRVPQRAQHFPGLMPGSRSVRHCSGSCGPTIRYRHTGCPRRRSSPGSRRWRPAGARHWSRCWPRSPTEELVVDLRSGSYAALGRLPAAVASTWSPNTPTATAPWSVTSTRHTRAGWRAHSSAAGPNPTSAAKVAAIARKAGMRVERDGNELTVVTDA